MCKYERVSAGTVSILHRFLSWCMHLLLRDIPTSPFISQGISFEVKPGQVVALVGPSGGGKSTCVRLIEHFYEISGGTILLGERDVRTLDPSWFRRHIGLVSQEPVLFASSIRDNIAYSNDSATQEEVGELLPVPMIIIFNCENS